MDSPLSPIKRKLYFYVLAAIFLITIPVLFLVASGYRLDTNWRLVPTGGLHISANETGAKLYIDDVLVKETAFFQHDFFVQNLKPGSYRVRVEKAAYRSWEKMLSVREMLVTDASSLLVPQKIEFTAIPRSLSDAAASSNSLYEEVSALFATTSRPVLSSQYRRLLAGHTAVVNDSVALWQDNGRIFAEWLGASHKTPFFFCTDVCKNTLFITTGEAGEDFDFFPGRSDVIVYKKGGEIRAIELDSRYPQNGWSIYSGTSPHIRVSDDTIYIQDGDSLFQVVL